VVNANSCTFENPCNSSQFTPTNVNTISNIAPNTNFYLAGGTNINYPKGPFTLNTGQSVFGRTPDFCQIAPRGFYPIINGNFILQSNNTMQAVMLFNDPVMLPVISMTNAANIVIDRVQVGPIPAMMSFATIPAGTFQTGIYMGNTNNVLITDSVINAGDSQVDSPSNAMGIVAKGSNFTLQNSAINVRDSTIASKSTVRLPMPVSAIYLYNTNNVNLQNNSITMVSDGHGTSTADPSSTIAMHATGIFIKNNSASTSIVNSKNDQFNLATYVNQEANGAIGDVLYSRAIQLFNYSGNLQANFTQDVFNLNDISLATNTATARDDNLVNVFVRGTNGSTTIVNTARNTFNTNSTVTSVSGNAYSTSQEGIYANARSNASITVNSTGDVFNLKSEANTNTGNRAINTNYNGFYLRGDSGGVITVNSKGDILNSTTNANNLNGLLARSYGHDGIYIRGDQTTSFTANSTNDTFNLNVNSVANIGTARARSVFGVINGSGYTALDRSIMNITGDNFNLKVNATGAVIDALTSATGAYARSSSVINLTDNVFKFTVRQNGAPGIVIPTRTSGNGQINFFGTNLFITY
jgi:hypothetical protein